MKQSEIDLLKQALTQFFLDRGIKKYEVIFDEPDGGISGIRHNYTDAESVFNFEARKMYLIKNQLEE